MKLFHNTLFSKTRTKKTSSLRSFPFPFSFDLLPLITFRTLVFNSLQTQPHPQLSHKNGKNHLTSSNSKNSSSLNLTNTTLSSPRLTDLTLLESMYPKDEYTNITPQIVSKLNHQLHLRPSHPIWILSKRIHHFFQHHLTSAWLIPPSMEQNNNHNYCKNEPSSSSSSSSSFSLKKEATTTILADASPFVHYTDLPPIVTKEQNFDFLEFPMDHPGRSKHDSYYLNQHYLLRTHTSAHQVELVQTLKKNNFLITADCYRRDEIDQHHYPVFHQMEGFRTFHVPPTLSCPSSLSSTLLKSQLEHDPLAVTFIANDLKSILEHLCHYLFNSKLECRWISASFPFTFPSWELEIKYKDTWLEVLGCGIVKQSILNHSKHHMAWAFGLGLERLAMVLFDIQDIRYFWSHDPRFLTSFQHLNPSDSKQTYQFQPFSHFSPCYKDLSFWVPTSSFQPNLLWEIVRSVAGDLIEEVKLIDTYTSPEGRQSACYRLTYRSTDRNVTNQEINAIQSKLREILQSEYHFQLR